MPTTSPSTPAPGQFRLAPRERNVFFGLMIGMLVASISQTIVGPAMPRIVAELGGMDHYSWVATAAMLVTAIVVPIVGKLSDLYGRRGFYIAGLVVFMMGSAVCGLSQNFWMLVAGRAIQGLGMGTIMPLSQTIVGDIIPPRHRGKYQGLMGAMFGVSSVVGPLAGGFITDHWGWRWLFAAAIPFGLAALVFLYKNLHLSHTPRPRARIDIPGMFVLTVTLVVILLATTWGGTIHPWGSATIVGMYAGGLVGLVAFVMIERRADDPVLPLTLFKSSVVSLSNVANFLIAMVMFGAIFYIPVFAQGVLGQSATGSSLVLTPLMLGLVIFGIVSGLVVTRTGRYKIIMLAGLAIMAVGQWLLTRLGHSSSPLALTGAMVVVGVGLGLSMQQYTLVVQNAVRQRELGVATASTQFFRNVGSTVGVAVFGTLMTSGLKTAIASHLPPGAAEKMARQGGSATASILDPEQLKGLPTPIVEAIRQGLADRLHLVFMAGIPLTLLAIVVTAFIKELPLRAHHDEPTGDFEQDVVDGPDEDDLRPETVVAGR